MNKTLFLIALVASSALALEIAPLEIRGTNSTDGFTTHRSVSCALERGRNVGTVEGELTIRPPFLSSGVCIVVSDGDGHLLFSCPLQGEERKDAFHFWFILKREYLKHAKLTLAEKERSCDLWLETVRIDETKQHEDMMPEMKE